MFFIHFDVHFSSLQTADHNPSKAEEAHTVADVWGLQKPDKALRVPRCFCYATTDIKLHWNCDTYCDINTDILP